ncbi:MAG: hypothetical protein QM820_24910 [Minicystis sp.]
MVALSAAGLEAMATRSAPGLPGAESLSWYRAIPPLALFGGDLLVRPWLRDVVPHVEEAEITAEPVQRGGHVTHERADAQRTLRRAEHALGQRRFDEAETLLRRLMEYPETDLPKRAPAVLWVALAAQDRAHEALALIHASGHPHGVVAYVYWCAGLFRPTSIVEGYRMFTEGDYADKQSWALQAIERGEVTVAEGWTNNLSRYPATQPSEQQNDQLIRADYAFLTGDLQKAAALLRSPFDSQAAPDQLDDYAASALRFDTLSALVDIARGDRARGSSVASAWRPEIGRTTEPEMSARVSAFHAFTLGLLQADAQDPTGAVMWFEQARSHITFWSRTGLDRRSLHRAALAVDLAAAILDPAPADPIGAARRLAERTVQLLGTTAEDFIARVLAVVAHRELARRLAEQGHEEATAEAHRALDLARPLAGRGVPAWEEMLRATERDAHTPSMR